MCQEDCVDSVIDFLTSTEECRNDPEVMYIVQSLESGLCSFRNGVDDPSSSCVFYNSNEDVRFIEPTLMSCLLWWLNGPSESCPQPFPFVPVNDTCQEVLEQTYDVVSCCYVNFYSQDFIIQNFTE